MSEQLTLSQAAQRIGVSTSALRHAIAAGRLDAEQVDSPRGPYWVVTAEALEAYLASMPQWWQRRKRAVHD